MPEMAELLRDGVVSDPFFETLNDGEWNACLGKQGEEYNYVVGYLDGAQLLVDTLLKQKLFGSRDTLAMPILYNARHGLELALKYFIRELSRIGMAKEREGAIDHDIKAYLDHLTAQEIGDLACRNVLVELKPFVESFAKHDIDGQELRYFQNQDGKLSLDQLAVVNMLLIQAGVTELRDIIGRFMDRVYRLREEIISDARTKECSRTDLIAIAHLVGAKASWSEQSFLDRKERVRERFGLTSNGFCRALNAIQVSRELKVLIGIESDLTFLSAAKIDDIVGLWLKVNSPAPANASPQVINGSEIDFDEMMRKLAEQGKLYRKVSGMISLEEFAEMQTIFYIGRDRLFGEQYQAQLDQTLEAHRREENRISLIQHILSKLNFVEGLASGLHKIGQPSLATTLLEMSKRARA